LRGGALQGACTITGISPVRWKELKMKGNESQLSNPKRGGVSVSPSLTAITRSGRGGKLKRKGGKICGKYTLMSSAKPKKTP